MPRSRTTEEATPAALGFSLPLESSHLVRARERLRDYLQLHCADPDLVADVVLCLEEACTNVIRHSGAREAMHVTLGFDDDALVCRVKDRGHGFDIESFDPEAVPDPLASQGRGLFLIAQIMDELRLRIDGGLEVCMIKRAVSRCGVRGPKATPRKRCGASTQNACPA